MLGAEAFDQLVVGARQLLANGRHADAVREYRQALATAHEPVPAEIWEECLELEAALDPGTDQQPDLTALIKRFPLRERPVELLMLMYQRTGNRKKALDTYHRFKAQLVIDNGSAPSDRLRHLHDAIQDEDVPTLDQLPVDVTHFVGRAGVLKRLDEPATVTVITGRAGVGKTALAVHWANRMRDHFPGGQLYLDLRGYDSGEPVAAEDALKTCLHALGLPPGTVVPGPVQARATLLRSMLARRQVLIVLDNASSAKQVRPLLDIPGGCAVVITSRDPLRSLPDVRHVQLGLLDVDESYLLLKGLLGASRVDAEPDAADALAWACGHLPLALRVAAGELATAPLRRITDAVTDLAGRNTPDQTTAALDVAYAKLPAPARTLLRRIGTAPGYDVTAGSAAALLGAPVDRPLATLAIAHLVTQHQPGRYRMHDLVRGYVIARSDEDSTEERNAALTRWVDYLIGAVDAAGITLSRTYNRLPRPRAADAPSFADGKEASDWLASEHHNVIAAVAWASENGLDTACAHLADALRSCFWLTQNLGDWTRVGELGLAAAQRDGDLELLAAMHCNLSLASYAHGRTAEAYEHNIQALELYEELDDWSGIATILINLCLGHSRPAREVITRMTRAHAIGVEHNCVDTQLIALMSLAINQMRLGKPRDALDSTTRGLEIVADDEPRQMPMVLERRGAAYLELGDLDRARKTLHEALQLCSASGNRINGIHCLHWLGHVSLRAGDDEHALAIYRLVLAETERLGFRVKIAGALTSIAETQARTNSAEALELADRALGIFRELGDILGQVTAHVVLADVYLMLGVLDTAATHVEDASALIEQHEIGLYAGRALHAQAAVHLAQQDHEQARQVVTLALAQHRKTGQRLHEVKDLMLLAEVLRQSGDERAADQHEDAASRLCREVAGPHAPDVLRAAWVRTRDPRQQP